MKQRIQVALLTALAAATVSAQDVHVYTTTIAQVWKQDTPGFQTSNFMPATEFLGIDADKLGNDRVSLHLYGWGTVELQDPSTIGGKDSGNLTYGYVQYDFDQANAQIKAGRFTVNQGVGNEAVDGVSARTDLKHGFTVSAFAGTPVIFKNLGSNVQNDIAFQRDFIFGTRLAWRFSKLGEIGWSYLQDGTTAAKDLPIPEPIDYTRRQMGLDLKVAPLAFLDLSGRTVFDVAKHPDVPGTTRPNIAEHDYNLTAKALESLSFTGTFVERNFQAYYAGSTLPSLFNMNEKGLFKADGLSATWAAIANLQVVADVRRTDRELFGTSTRAGADFRYNFTAQHLLAGMGYHKVNAFKVVQVDPMTPSFSVSHSEARMWAIYEQGAFSASLDGIRLHYSDPYRNPSVNSRAIESQIVGSLGYQAMATLKLSADVSYADTPLYTKQVMGLLRVEYRFGFAGKGGK